MSKKSLLYNNDKIDEIYNILKNTFLFQDLDEESLKNIIQECKLVTFKKNETVDSDIAKNDLFIILKGRIKIMHIDPHTGRSLAIFLKSIGEIFDIFTLLDNKEHTVFPIFMDNVITLKIPTQRAREWICKYPNFNKNFLPYLGEKMRKLENFGTSLVFHNTTIRLANLILKHTYPHKIEDHYPVTLINNLSHESLAELIGSVRSVVSTQMQKLKENGIIISKRGKLEVKDLKKLIDLCDE